MNQPLNLENLNILDEEYYKIYTLSNLILNDEYTMNKPLSHQLRENILFQFYIEYRKLDKNELIYTYNDYVNKLKLKYRL